jgi:hypothetical protein
VFSRPETHNSVGYDYARAVSDREPHNDRFYCNMICKKAGRARKVRFPRNSALMPYVSSTRLVYWRYNVRVLPYNYDFGDGRRPCGER